jgi:peptidoglycan/xylan/chitin deacetylase (PgdA/CDA1 family)
VGHETERQEKPVGRLGAANVDIAIAICARPKAAALGPSLAALRAAGAAPVVVPVAVLRGLAEARNQALAATGAEVLAFVDDDVAVAPGWLVALQRAWAAAPADRGCIGGPIGARFLGPRPAWLVDELLGVLGVSEGGSTFHGGNVSFRTEALRGVGGFWPARGRAELRDWFSEEHFAQHELAEAGWSIAAEPGMAAERLIDPARLTRRDVLERRARYGARSALIGERRPRMVAARNVARSAVGAAAAVAGNDRARATERAARAAENAGALAAPLIAQRDLEPVAHHTQFRHSIAHPPRRSWRRRRSGPGPTILVYHRVDDDAHSPSIAPERFAAHMEVLRDRRIPVSLPEIVAGDAPTEAVTVTFDDGYAATMRNVLPALEAAGVAATVFVPTAHVGKGRPFWWDEVPRLLRGIGDDELRLTIGSETRSWARADRAERHVIAWLQPKAPEAIEVVVDELRRRARLPAGEHEAERPVTVEELRRLATRPLMTIGSHTRSHINLRFASARRRSEELEGSRADLARWLGTTPPAGLAYPFGIPGADVDDATTRAAAQAGFDHAVVIAPGTVTARSDQLALPRVPVPDVDADAFAALLDGARRRR